MSFRATGAELGRRLRERDLTAAPAVLNLLESTAHADKIDAAALLRAVSPARLGHEAQGHIIGVTGPPGAGKSTLLAALLEEWRKAGKTVAMLAVDPSSKRSGGALLGDRARIDTNPGDQGTFVRSTAAGERLGGLARGTRSASQALAAAFDIVVIETVGVGQAETEVADVADTVAVVVQPGSGDVLQFLKSGIMETPDLLVVTKQDLGSIAIETRRDLHSALRSLSRKLTPVVMVSSLPPTRGIDALVKALAQLAERADVAGHRREARRMGALADFTIEYGQRGLTKIGGRKSAELFLQKLDPDMSEPELEAALAAELERRMPA